jgi:hypothetical protein
MAGPGVATAFDVPATIVEFGGRSQDQPNAARVGGRTFVGWRTQAAAGRCARRGALVEVIPVPVVRLRPTDP